MTTRYFVPRCSLKRPLLNWRNCLLDVEMLHENCFTCLNDLCLWNSESSSSVMPLLHADWTMLKNASSHGEANSVTVASWHTKSRLQMLVASKAAFVKNYLVVSTWILNGSLIECHEKKHFQFVWYLIGSWRFKFLGKNLLGAGPVKWMQSKKILIFFSTFRSGFSKSIRIISKGCPKCFHILNGFEAFESSRNCFKYSEKQISLSHGNEFIQPSYGGP